MNLGDCLRPGNLLVMDEGAQVLRFDPGGEVEIRGLRRRAYDFPFNVPGGGRFGCDDVGVPFAPLDLVRKVTLSSLKKALLRAEQGGWVRSLTLTHDGSADLDNDYSLRLPITIEFVGDQLALELRCENPVAFDEGGLASAIKPLLEARNCELISIDIEGTRTSNYARLTLIPPTRGRLVGDVVALGNEILGFVAALEGTEITKDSVRSLLEAKSPQLLVGLVESSWFEAKSHSYDLNTHHGALALASDVSRFANSPEGGLLVIGLFTKSRKGTDVVSGVNSIAPRSLSPRRYLKRIDQLVYPAIVGVQVVRFEWTHDAAVLLIDVPPQQERLKPFLVHGAIVDDHVEGAYISIMQRRGEDAVPVTASAIHSALVAGRAVIEGRRPPDTF